MAGFYRLLLTSSHFPRMLGCSELFWIIFIRFLINSFSVISVNMNNLISFITRKELGAQWNGTLIHISVKLITVFVIKIRAKATPRKVPSIQCKGILLIVMNWTRISLEGTDIACKRKESWARGEIFEIGEGKVCFNGDVSRIVLHGVSAVLQCVTGCARISCKAPECFYKSTKAWIWN